MVSGQIIARPARRPNGTVIIKPPKSSSTASVASPSSSSSKVVVLKTKDSVERDQRIKKGEKQRQKRIRQRENARRWAKHVTKSDEESCDEISIEEISAVDEEDKDVAMEEEHVKTTANNKMTGEAKEVVTGKVIEGVTEKVNEATKVNELVTEMTDEVKLEAKVTAVDEVVMVKAEEVATVKENEMGAVKADEVMSESKVMAVDEVVTNGIAKFPTNFEEMEDARFVSYLQSFADVMVDMPQKKLAGLDDGEREKARSAALDVMAVASTWLQKLR